MARLCLSSPQRDVEGQYDFFVIRSDEPLTQHTNSPVPAGWNPVPRLILLATASDETDSRVLRQLMELLLHRPKSMDKAPVISIIVRDEYTLQVSGSWLNTGLLKHWIRELFKSDDIDVVDSTDVPEPYLQHTHPVPA